MTSTSTSAGPTPLPRREEVPDFVLSAGTNRPAAMSWATTIQPAHQGGRATPGCLPTDARYALSTTSRFAATPRPPRDLGRVTLLFATDPRADQRAVTETCDDRVICGDATRTSGAKLPDVSDAGYAQAEDGTHIAYRADRRGPEDGGTDIVMVSGGLIPVEVYGDEPGFARMLDGLMSLGRLVVFDRRGIGVSDPINDWDRSLLDQWAEDPRPWWPHPASASPSCTRGTDGVSRPASRLVTRTVCFASSCTTPSALTTPNTSSGQPTGASSRSPD